MKNIKNILISLSAFSILIWNIQACYENQSSHLDIINGETVKRDSLSGKSTVSIYYGGRSICSATVIAEKLLVTASHCIDSVEKEEIKIWFPHAQSDSATDPEDKVFVEIDSMQSFHKEKAELFPNFDIAWIKLKEAVPQPYVPAEILRDKTQLEPRQKLILSGFGKTATVCHEDCSGELLQVDVHLQKLIDNARYFSLLVFGSEDAKGFCSGDSGGPAYTYVNGKGYLIGAANGYTSIINPKAFEDRSSTCESGEGIYTFVGDYADWIESTSGITLVNSHQGEASKQKIAPLNTKLEKWEDWFNYNNYEDDRWVSFFRIMRQIALRSTGDERYQVITDAQLGLEAARKARTVSLSGSSFDFSSLTGSEKPVPVIDPLQFFTSLVRLNLNGLKLKNLSVLKEIDSLQQLSLIKLKSNSAAQKLDLSILSQLGLEKLTLVDLNASDTNIATIDLDFLHNLTSLVLRESDIDTLRWSSAIANHTVLENLELTELPLSKLDLTSNFELRLLKLVDLEDTAITLPKTAESLKKIEIRRSNNTFTSSMSDLDLPVLNELELVDLGLTNIAFLPKLPMLKKLDLSANQLEELEDPTQFAHVEELNLSDNLLSDIDFISHLPNLKTVNLRGNPLPHGTKCPDTVECVMSLAEPTSLLEACELYKTGLANPGRFGLGELFKEWRHRDALEDILSKLNYKNLDYESFTTPCEQIVEEAKFIEEIMILSLSEGQVSDVVRFLPNLKDLSLYEIFFSEKFDFIKLNQIQDLDITSGNHDSFIRSFQLKNLRSLRFEGSIDKELSIRGPHSNLEKVELDIEERDYALDLMFLTSLPMLKELIIDVPSLANVEVFSQLESLITLDLELEKEFDLTSVWNNLAIEKLRLIWRGDYPQSCELKNSQGTCLFGWQSVYPEIPEPRKPILSLDLLPNWTGNSVHVPGSDLYLRR